MRKYDKKRKRQGIPLRYLLPGLGAVLLGTVTMGDVMPQSTLPAFAPPPELRSNGKWDAFKALWREVNAIEPAHPEIVPPEGRRFVDLNLNTEPLEWIEFAFGRRSKERLGPDLPDYDKRSYYLALDEERAMLLRAALFKLFDLPVSDVDVLFWQRDNDVSIANALTEKNASVETRMLARLLQLRIYQMSMHNYMLRSGEYVVTEEDSGRSRAGPSPVGRLADVPPSFYMISAIDRIEARIDALIGLRTKGVISESVFAAALADIQNDAKLVLFLDVLKDGLPWIGKKNFSEPLLAKDADLRNVQVWERAVEAGMRRLPQSSMEKNKQQAQAELLKNRLAELRAAYPHLEGLLAELER